MKRTKTLALLAGLSSLFIAATANADGSFAPAMALLAGIPVVSPLPATSIRVTPPAFGMAFLFDGGVPVGALEQAGAWTVASGRTYTVTVMPGPVRIWTGAVNAAGGVVDVVFSPLPSAAPPPPPVAVGPSIVPEMAFRGLLSAVSNSAFDRDRVTLLRDVAPRHLWSVEHVRALLEELDFESSKLRVVRALAPYVLDPENAYALADDFEFASNQRKVREMFGASEP